jgi:hypothetical protein
MAVIKIPRQYLVGQDEDSITIEVPDTVLVNWQQHQITSADRVRDQLAGLNLTEADVADAVAWASQED